MWKQKLEKKENKLLVLEIALRILMIAAVVAIIIIFLF